MSRNERAPAPYLSAICALVAVIGLASCKQVGPAAAPSTNKAAIANPPSEGPSKVTEPAGKPQPTGPKTAPAKPTPTIDSGVVAAATTPSAKAQVVEATPPKANEPPSFELPVYTSIGIGQEVGFGLEVIDKESDRFKVELISKPAGATFDPYTLTVVFKPTAADGPEAHFVVRITETLRSDGSKRVFTHPFAITVADKPQPLPKARPLGAAVEQLLTIHDERRLQNANQAWTMSRLLTLNAELAKQALPAGQQKGAKIDPKALYNDFLAAMAKAHANPTLDPSSKKFDADTWGDPSTWKIIAVRARLDKSWHEVRVVLKAKAHAATYAMFKYRPVGAAADLPAEARAHNNRMFGELVLKHFFTKDGALNPAHTSDKALHAKAVAAFLNDVLLYKNPHKDKPWATPGLAALPCEARLGGGTFRDADGNIAGGDAWGWNVQKPTYVPLPGGGGRLKYVNIPIKGFLTDVVPTADNTAWAMRCGDMFEPKSKTADPNKAGLCRASGHVDLPAGETGYADTPKTGAAVKSFVDAAHLFWEHKNVDMVKTVPLRDPRRDVFEEKGMTCHQCHVRAFGVRDMHDVAAYDPKAMPTKGLNKSQATTYFVLVPTTHWQPYTIDFQHKQECKAKVNLEKYAGAKTDLTCPLNAAMGP